MLYCTELGELIDPKRDWEEWGEILDIIGIPYREPHVTRRTGATFFLLMGVDRRATMSWFGWKSEKIMARYQDVPDQVLIDTAREVGERYYQDHVDDPATRSATRARNTPFLDSVTRAKN